MARIKNGFEKIKTTIKRYNPDADIQLVEKAFNMAAAAHEGVKRKSGAPYIIHPLAVALLLAELQMDTDTICAGLLHDTIEDTGVSCETIETVINPAVLGLVLNLTKVDKIATDSIAQQKTIDFNMFIGAINEDIRVGIIKLADRYDNVQSLNAFKKVEKRRRISMETLNVYAKLAARLGIYKFKYELEDRGFEHTSPESYKEIKRIYESFRSFRERETKRLGGFLSTELAKADIDADVTQLGRNIYGLAKIMSNCDISATDIAQRLALKVIVSRVSDCYLALGALHKLWRPLSASFVDYIGSPRQNMYQSLHTAVVGFGNMPMDVIIRTERMDTIAEIGIAAFWEYRESANYDANFLEKFKPLVSDIETVSTVDQMEETDKIVLDNIIVYTPKGDRITLPMGATPVDFAYKIHTSVGHKCLQARVNGRFVALNYQLIEEDIVEIDTGKTPNPHENWLSFVVTGTARGHIRSFLREKKREETQMLGRQIMVSALARIGKKLDKLERTPEFAELLKKYGYSDRDRFYAGISLGKPRVNEFIQKLFPAEALSAKINIKVKTPTIGGRDNMQPRRAKCCKPIPGDQIVAYMSPSHGLMIHRKDCHVLAGKPTNEENMIDAGFQPNKGKTYSTALLILANDRSGLLAEIAAAICDVKHTELAKCAIATFQHGKTKGDFVVRVRDTAHLRRVITRIERVKDVTSVRRVISE